MDSVTTLWFNNNDVSVRGVGRDPRSRARQRTPSLPSPPPPPTSSFQVGDLVEFLDEVVATFPNVTYLSLMRNPASPPLVCLSEEDVQATQRYRLYVIFRLPRLQFLDSGPVLAEERKEAAARGQFLAVRKPKAKSQSTMGKPVTPGAVGGVFGAL